MLLISFDFVFLDMCLNNSLLFVCVRYGSYPLRGKYCHEMALRIVLACIEVCLTNTYLSLPFNLSVLTRNELTRVMFRCFNC